MHHLNLVVLLVLGAATAVACDLKYDPVLMPQYYRSEGWDLPGINDFNPHASATTSELPTIPNIPGVMAQVVSHDETPYIITMPAQAFLLNGKRQNMRKLQAEAGIIRLMVNGRVVAYSYGLTPLQAHRENGRWVLEWRLGCIFDATFIDDTGDGVFRVLVPGSLTADLVPSWARKDKN